MRRRKILENPKRFLKQRNGNDNQLTHSLTHSLTDTSPRDFLIGRDLHRVCKRGHCSARTAAKTAQMLKIIAQLLR